MLLLPEVIGSLAVVVMLASLFGLIRSRIPEARAQILLGISFGLVAMFQMNAPLNMVPGVIVDMRNVPVALAGAFLGWRAALLCLVMAASMRGYIGGIGMPSGIAAMSIACLAGMMWNRWTLRPQRRGIVTLFALSVMVSAHLVAAFIMPWEVCVAFLSTLALPMAALNMLSIPIAAIFLDHERVRALTERRMATGQKVDPVTGLASFDAFARDALALSQSDANVRVAGILAIRIVGRDRLARALGRAKLDQTLSAIRVRLESMDLSGLPVATTEDGRVVMGLNFHQVADLDRTEINVRRLLNDQKYLIDDDLALRIGVSVQTHRSPTLALLQTSLNNLAAAPKLRNRVRAGQPSGARQYGLANTRPMNCKRNNHLFETARVLWEMK